MAIIKPQVRVLQCVCVAVCVLQYVLHPRGPHEGHS